jgi:hypothetical protein
MMQPASRKARGSIPMILRENPKNLFMVSPLTGGKIDGQLSHIAPDCVKDVEGARKAIIQKIAGTRRE